MNVLRTFCSGIVAFIGLGSAALAVPVTFTYTSNKVDWSVLEEWEARFMASSINNWNVLRPDGPQARLVLDVECDITGPTVTCASFSGPQPTVLETYRLPATGSGITVREMSDFTDNRLLASDFRVGPDGKVVSWQFRGTEYGSAGDFYLSSAGDYWAYGGAHRNYEFAYCLYAHGSAEAVSGAECENGAPIGNAGKFLDLGTGSWTSNLVLPASVAAVPLPAGLPVMLTGLAALGFLRRGRAAG